MGMRWVAGMILSILCLSGQATEPVLFDYMMNCQGCHLPNGEGYPQRDVPAIKNHMGKFLYVEGGREFLVQVPGTAQSDLDSTRLAALLNWMLETFSPDQLPDHFLAYSASEVERLRKTPLIDVRGVRLGLMQAIEAYEAVQEGEQ